MRCLDVLLWILLIGRPAANHRFREPVSCSLTCDSRDEVCAFQGIGKPEALKHGFQGYWSRRITDEHRLVYKIAGDEIRIAACRYHYGK